MDHEGRKIKCGVIPSKYKIEEDLLQRSSLADLDHESRRSSTSARRSFFRRRKHTRSSSRDSKEIASFSDASALHMGSSEGLGLASLLAMQVQNLPLFDRLMIAACMFKIDFKNFFVFRKVVFLRDQCHMHVLVIIFNPFVFFNVYLVINSFF